MPCTLYGPGIGGAFRLEVVCFGSGVRGGMVVTIIIILTIPNSIELQYRRCSVAPGLTANGLDISSWQRLVLWRLLNKESHM